MQITVKRIVFVAGGQKLEAKVPETGECYIVTPAQDVYVYNGKEDPFLDLGKDVEDLLDNEDEVTSAYGKVRNTKQITVVPAYPVEE